MYDRILVGTDGSRTAGVAVERAVAVAKSTGARLTILSAGRADKAEKVVAKARDAHAGSGVDIDTATTEDDPVHGLIDLAREGGYDLIVVGNKGMTGLTRFLHIGSVPNKVSHHLPTSLLIVKTT